MLYLFSFWIGSQVVFLSISEPKCQRLGLPILGFRNESIEKLIIRENRFEESRDGFVSFSGGLGSCFSDFLSRENKLENTTPFSDITKSESGTCWGRSPRYLCPLKSSKRSLIAEYRRLLIVKKIIKPKPAALGPPMQGWESVC